jgi:hypothetical protein
MQRALNLTSFLLFPPCGLHMQFHCSVRVSYIKIFFVYSMMNEIQYRQTKMQNAGTLSHSTTQLQLFNQSTLDNQSF